MILNLNFFRPCFLALALAYFSIISHSVPIAYLCSLVICTLGLPSASLSVDFIARLTPFAAARIHIAYVSLSYNSNVLSIGLTILCNIGTDARLVFFLGAMLVLCYNVHFSTTWGLAPSSSL